MKTVLAIDQSTSATKAVLFDSQGKVLDRASREHDQIYPQPGWVEHDPEQIWQNVLAVIHEVARRNPACAQQLLCLSLANQRETFVIFDRKTGCPLHNAIVWQCRRAEEICQHFGDPAQDQLVREKTGLKVDTYFSGPKMKWLIGQDPGLASKLKSGEAVLGTIDTYLIHRLTNGQTTATDSTNASRTLLFDIKRLGWDERLCELFDVPPRALAQVRESNARFGDTDAGGALRRPLPICGVMGDSQASLFAQRCFGPGMAKATVGTGTSVLLNIGDTFRLTGDGTMTALAWVLQQQPTYACEGLINFSAATLSWLKNQLGLFAHSSEIEPLATTVPDNGGVYFVPAFAGLSAPYWSPKARAAIVGLTAFTRREHIVRAAEEAIAYQIRDVLDMMSREAKVHLASLHADGGPARDRFLMQFISDITQLQLKVLDLPEASAWGAAMMGLLGLGVHDSLVSLAGLESQVRIYQPSMSSTQARELHQGWQSAVQRVL